LNLHVLLSELVNSAKLVAVLMSPYVWSEETCQHSNQKQNVHSSTTERKLVSGLLRELQSE
jgi:hypothetical protein